jgi:bifunctional UDP-N-acetylglucosamine pyrophosphorylase / glucosamine-1-phosphate N-acetyltransferase
MSTKKPRWAVAILAAGQGTRMHSEIPKVLHELADRPLLDHVIDLALEFARPHDVVVVVGHRADAVVKVVRERGIREVVQEPQNGTGDALRVALEGLRHRSFDRLVVLSGDVPLLRPESLRRLTAGVEKGHAAALLTAVVDVPGSYGRIIRAADGSVSEIVEAADARPDQLEIREVNAGVYAFDRRHVTDALAELGSDNAQGEVYLTDVAAELRHKRLGVAAVRLEDPEEMQGVNTRADLARAGRVLNEMVVGDLMADGVSIRDPLTTWIDPRAVIGREVVIEPGVVLRGFCHVGNGARIGANCVLEDAAVGAGETVPPLTYLTGK